MSPLCILHVLFSSRVAGSERYCIDLANRQAAAGHRVHVAGRRGSAIAGELSPAVNFHGFSLRLLHGWNVRRLAANLRADICHGHLSAGCKALRRMPPEHRTAATLHVGYKPHQHDALNALICVNHTQSAHLSGYRGIVRTVHNWLPACPAASSKAMSLRHELGLSSDVFMVGAVGRLHRSKGMDVLVRAFRRHASRCAALVIFGEGPQRAELERLATGDSRIHLLGFRRDVRQHLAELDLFVSPSREESFGLAIVEAMASGAPIITSCADGPAEFLRQHPVTFVPVDAVDPLGVAIVEAHERFVAGTLFRLKYDMSAFDADAQLARITEVYRDVLNVKAVRPPETRRVPALAT